MAAPAPGLFVISLDFELHWGVRDHRSVDDYRANLLGVRQAIPKMLELFRAHGVHATWATVGLLFFDSQQELEASLPSRLPAYADANLSPYPELANIGANEDADPFHYGASLLRRIQATPGQEIATHTFGHYFCLEKGQTVEDFEADLAAAKRAAARFHVELKSLVFPRNQFNREYLDACRRAGILAYRGNQRSSLYAASDTISDKSKPKRAARLMDAYLPLTGGHARSLAEIAQTGEPYDIPASRFLRAYSPALAAFEGLRLARIEREMTDAARRGLVYHLWWHPHNFGAHTDENISALARLLGRFDALRREHGFESRAMGEVAEQLRAARASAPATANA
jgi:peptidoglycan/xylan/chitin deacetylase (PgdA/CDA1 family)